VEVDDDFAGVALVADAFAAGFGDPLVADVRPADAFAGTVVPDDFLAEVVDLDATVFATAADFGGEAGKGLGAFAITGFGWGDVFAPGEFALGTDFADFSDDFAAAGFAATGFALVFFEFVGAESSFFILIQSHLPSVGRPSMLGYVKAFAYLVRRRSIVN